MKASFNQFLQYKALAKCMEHFPENQYLPNMTSSESTQNFVFGRKNYLNFHILRLAGFLNAVGLTE